MADVDLIVRYVKNGLYLNSEQREIIIAALKEAMERRAFNDMRCNKPIPSIVEYDRLKNDVEKAEAEFAKLADEKEVDDGK